MSRVALILGNPKARAQGARWCMNAPAGTRVEFKETKRSIPQNDRMWAMLTDVSKQAIHMGRKYSPEQWKAIFMHALGQEVEFLPSLDGATFIPVGYHSSDLGKSEMAALIDLIHVEGAKLGVVFHDEHSEAA